MDIVWFTEFAVLAETLHYQLAADKLYTTQSTLSKHIQAMERELGAALFVRSYHKLELTPFGRMMLPHAYEMIRIRGNYEEAAYRMLHSDSKVLRIDAIPALPEYEVTDKVLKFKQKYPDVQIAFSEADSIIIRKELLEQHCDLAIMRGSRSIPDASYVSRSEDMLRRLPIHIDELVAVLPIDHPLAKEKAVDLRDLRNDSFVLIKEGSLPYQLCMSACKSAGFIPKVDFTSHSRDAILDMVEKGGCTGMMFSSHVKKHKQDIAYSAIPIRPAVYAEVFIAYLRHHPLSEYAEYFISLFEEDND